jgi:hypothetical protein
MACVAAVGMGTGVYFANRGPTWQQVKDSVQAELDAEVVNFDFPTPGDGAYLMLEPARGEEIVSPADVVTAIAVVDRLRSKSQRLSGALDLRIDLRPGGQVGVRWWDPGDGSGVRLMVIEDFQGRYGEWFCQLPMLERLPVMGPGSDFTRIGECNPNAQSLPIAAWQDSVGCAGIGALGHLKRLDIGGAVADPRELPFLESLEGVRLHLVDDTVKNRAIAKGRFPRAEVEFFDSEVGASSL